MSKLKDAFENNIFIVLLGVALAAGSTVFAVVQYFHSQTTARLEKKHSAEISQLASRLASIERGMPDQQYFDVRRLVYTSGGETDVPVAAHYFSDDKFYAPLDIDFWKYEKTTDLD